MAQRLIFFELNQNVSTVNMRYAKSLPKTEWAPGQQDGGGGLISMKILKYIQKNFYQKETDCNGNI